MGSDKKKSRLVLVGFASNSRNLAPARDADTEVISLNHAYQFIPEDGWDRWYELHPMDHVLKDIPRGGQVVTGNQHLEWLARDHGDRPIYMQRHYEEIKNSVPWPRDEINAWFAARGMNKPGWYPDEYWTSTISEMLALAIWEHGTGVHPREAIEIYGVDLLQDEEYFYQRSGAELMIGYAWGMGIQVYIPPQSALCKASYIYGYTEPASFDAYTPLVTFFEKQRDQAEQKRTEAQAHYHTMHGAVQMADVALSAPNLTDEVKAAVTAKREETRKKMEEYAKASIALEAQKSALDAVAAWTKAHARGTVLQA